MKVEYSADMKAPGDGAASWEHAHRKKVETSLATAREHLDRRTLEANWPLNTREHLDVMFRGLRANTPTSRLDATRKAVLDLEKQLAQAIEREAAPNSRPLGFADSAPFRPSEPNSLLRGIAGYMTQAREALAGGLDRISVAVAPAVWIEGQTKAALREVPGETQAARLYRLAGLVGELTQNNPAGLSARHEAGYEIAKALKVEASAHTLTHEGLLKQADELEANWSEAKQAAFDERLENHVAATEALWGYDPVNAERTLQQREQEAVTVEWNAMTPVDREHHRQYLAGLERSNATEHELRFAVLAQACQGEAAKAQYAAWAKDLSDTARAEQAVATAALILENNNDLSGGLGIDGERDANLRNQLALLADYRMSDGELDGLREQGAGLQLKLLDSSITPTELSQLEEIQRRATLADTINRALYSVAHGLDFSVGEAIATDQPRLSNIVDYGEAVRIEPKTPAYDRAWEGLREYLVATGLGDGTDLGQGSASHEGWMHMASYELNGEIAHNFRHSDHPYTGQRENVTVRDGADRALADQREPIALEAANSR